MYRMIDGALKRNTSNGGKFPTQVIGPMPGHAPAYVLRGEQSSFGGAPALKPRKAQHASLSSMTGGSLILKIIDCNVYKSQLISANFS